jgi:DNA-binding LacI/PurR family transcriptional regulator
MKIEDIAKKLGISKSTVSLAINNKPGVGVDTRKKILEIVRNSGYIPRTMIKNDQKNIYNKTIKFLVFINPEKDYYESNISTSFFQQLINGMEKESAIYNYRLMFSSIRSNNFTETIKEVAKDEDYVGVVLLATNLGEEEVFFASKNIPNLVVVDNIYDLLHANFVVINNRIGSYNACLYLINLGHKNIGYVQSKIRITNFCLRKEGFLTAIKRNNLEIGKDNFYTVRNDIRLAQKDFTILLKNQSRPLPTALFCENDYMAIGVIKALQDYGKKIPDDISIIGFDNVPESIAVQPELTTVNVNKTKMGELSIRMLLSNINSEKDEKIYLKQLLDTYPVERNSCKSL